jgi:hypothetical protein
MWGIFVAGCVMHKNVEIGEVAAHHLFQLEPNESLEMACGVATVIAKMRGLSLVKNTG